MASPIVKFHKRSKTAIEENLKHVEDGTLTIEEAAKCLAGAQIKARDELGGGPALDFDAEYRQALHALESRKESYDGIVPGRHM